VSLYSANDEEDQGMLNILQLCKSDQQFFSSNRIAHRVDLGSCPTW